MDSFALQRLARDPGWLELLAAYEDGDALPAEDDSSDDSEGWIPRIDTVPGVEDEHLPRLHGRLIAFGLLRFQLTSATTGVVYRLTPKGRDALSRTAAEIADEGSDRDEAAAADEGDRLAA